MVAIHWAGEATLTGQNQLTLPAESVRLIRARPGDRYLVGVIANGVLVLTPRPTNWTACYAGKLTHVFADPDANRGFLELERSSWDEN